MGRWLEALRARKSQETGPQGSAESAIGAFVTCGTALPEASASNPGTYERLLQEVELAGGRQTLGAISDNVEAAFQAGALSRFQAEELTRVAIRRSRSLAQDAINARERKSKSIRDCNWKVGTCYACGKEQYWIDKLDNRKCRICHPPPPGAESKESLSNSPMA